MSGAITIVLPYPPSVNSLWRIFKPPKGGPARIIISKKGREYRKRVAECVLLAGSPTIGDARLHVDIQLYPPDKRKRDLDNVRKAVNDSLEAAGVFNNDEQIDSDSGKKHPKDKDPRLVVTVTPLKS